MMASVVNYLYFTVIGDRHVGIYASPDNWRTYVDFSLLSCHSQFIYRYKKSFFYPAGWCGTVEV